MMSELYTFSFIASIALFTLSTVLTPGPNNIMLLTSGLTFGYKKTLPHIFGVMIGFPLMVICVGLGLGIVFESYPIILDILKIVGFIYLLWMAYKIATNVEDYSKEKHSNSRPFTFMEAALFQWVNPKAWIMAMTVISLFVVSDFNSYIQIIVIAFIYLLSGVISTNSWAMGGVFLKKVLTNKKHMSLFNKIMAVILVGSVIPFLFQ
jgi:threonine/homoserine/homoserine lactone efflux protein